MKVNFLYLFLCLGLLTWTACGDDDDDAGSRGELNYAGPQFTAPQLSEGNNVFAAYFPGNRTREFVGRTLEEIEFELVDIPLAVYVSVYRAFPGDEDAPGDRIYDLDVTDRLINAGRTGRFNVRLTPTSEFPDPVEITGEGLWLAVEVEHAANTSQSVGCDQGRDYSPNGDRVFFAATQRWTDFQSLTGERVNWNIKGFVSAE